MEKRKSKSDTHRQYLDQIISINPFRDEEQTSEAMKKPREDIEWQVLKVKDGKALCISKYAVDARRWNVETDPTDDAFWKT